MSFITLIIVISVLVFVHELGHFLVAKFFKVRVDEFAIGFPPRLWSIKRGETTYAINLILFGGYVKIFGETPDDASISGPDSGRSFVNKNRAAQALILIAGIAMNIAFAWALISASLYMGVKEAASSPEQGTSILVTEVVQGSPAEAAGLQPNDIITSITDGEGITSDRTNSEVLQSAIAYANRKPIVVDYIRGDDKMTASIEPASGIIENKTAIGVAMVDIADSKYGFFESLWYGAKSTWRLTVDTAYAIIGFLSSIFSFNADLKQVAGPVGIASYLNQAREYGVTTLFMLVSVISVNLAVVNLLPFPALDGGRLLFVAIEAIIRRPIKPKVANMFNAIGFGLLLLLMLVITVSDVGKLIKF